MSASPVTALGPGAEFDRVRAIWQRIAERGEGLGDDAAVVRIGAERIAISTDLSIEEQHFRLDWLTAQEIGWRAAAGACSDLAAMAAEPRGVLASVALPPRHSEAFLGDLMQGVAQAAACVGANVWGGDLARAERVTVDVVVVGGAVRPVYRSGARPGDALWVTGRLGGPHEALRAWRAGEVPSPEVRERFAHPVPRVPEAAWLRDRGATALIDISDGLVGDTGHIAAASGVACVIDADRVPVDASVTDPASALVGGEEYELLVAVPAGARAGLGKDFAEEFGLPLTRIGTVERGAGVRVERAGAPVDVAEGFSHF